MQTLILQSTFKGHATDIHRILRLVKHKFLIVLVLLDCENGGVLCAHCCLVLDDAGVLVASSVDIDRHIFDVLGLFFSLSLIACVKDELLVA